MFQLVPLVNSLDYNNIVISSLDSLDFLNFPNKFNFYFLDFLVKKKLNILIFHLVIKKKISSLKKILSKNCLKI